MKIYVTTLGLAILAVFAFTVAVFTLDHHVTEEATPAAAAPTTPTMAAAAGGSNTHSYAGQAPANAAELAAGVHFNGWTFSGGAPGPVIHVRQGQKVHVTLTNKGAIPHSIDFHAARVAPNVAF